MHLWRVCVCVNGLSLCGSLSCVKMSAIWTLGVSTNSWGLAAGEAPIAQARMLSNNLARSGRLCKTFCTFRVLPINYHQSYMRNKYCSVEKQVYLTFYSGLFSLLEMYFPPLSADMLYLIVTCYVVLSVAAVVLENVGHSPSTVSCWTGTNCSFTALSLNA